MDTEYLEPGFDPSSLKVAQLRRILTENGVEFQPQAKKSALIGLYDERVKPKIPSLRKNYENLLPSDKGIVKVGTDTKKKRKKRKKQDKRPSSSENVDAGTTGGESSTNTQGADVQESTPFSDVNEFQQSSQRKARKRKVADVAEAKDAEGDLEMDVKPEKGEKKRRRKIGEGDHTPITDKVAQKTPKKSPHKSLTIDKFESSSSSDSSFNESSILNVSRRDISGHLSVEKSSPRNDFSFSKKSLTPDLTKLKVSPAFEKELKVAYRDSSVPVLARVDEQPGADKVNLSGPADVSITRLESSRSATPAFALNETTPEAEADSSEETVKSSDNNGENSSGEPEPRIETPELITEQDVQDSNDRVEIMRETIDRISEKVQNLPTRPSIKFPSFVKTLAKVLQSVFLFALIMVPIIYGLWYREQRVLVGYCGHEIQPKQLFAYESPVLNNLESFLETQRPSCIPCPDHAICYPYLKIKCKPEYSLRRNKLGLYGLIPLSDTCVKDSKREKLVAEVVKKSLEFLRTKNAQHSCGECEDDLKSGMTEEELYQIFYESRAPWINDEEFDSLWAQAVADLVQEPEITWRQVSNTKFFQNDTTFGIFFTNDITLSRQLPNSGSPAIDGSGDDTKTDGLQGKEGHLSEADGTDKKRIFRSTSKKYIGLRCKFEREISNTYRRFAPLIWTVTLVGVLIRYLSYRIRKYYKQREEVKQISKKVVAKLKAVKRQQQEVGFLSTVQLRDVLLANITDLKRKNLMWQEVVKILENNNTNVKSSLMEIHGEIMKCWEWIGPVEDESVSESRQNVQQHQ